MAEKGLSPRDATRESMNEITGALVGIALVLSAVFIPMAFFGGSTGVIYRQFSITIVSAMLLSVLVAVTLSPALCATLLKPAAAADSGGHAPRSRLARAILRCVQPRVRSQRRPLPARRGRPAQAQQARTADLCAADRRCRGAVRAPAHRLPARRGPGHPAAAGQDAGRRHGRAPAAGDEQRRGVSCPAEGHPLLQPGDRRRRRPGHRPGLHRADRLERAHRAGGRTPLRCRGAWPTSCVRRCAMPRCSCCCRRRYAGSAPTPGSRCRCRMSAASGRRRSRRRATASSNSPTSDPSSTACAATTWSRHRSSRSRSTTAASAR